MLCLILSRTRSGMYSVTWPTAQRLPVPGVENRCSALKGIVTRATVPMMGEIGLGTPIPCRSAP
eukprot:1676147-Rhodomonas_salina.2